MMTHYNSIHFPRTMTEWCWMIQTSFWQTRETHFSVDIIWNPDNPQQQRPFHFQKSPIQTKWKSQSFWTWLFGHGKLRGVSQKWQTYTFHQFRSISVSSPYSFIILIHRVRAIEMMPIHPANSTWVSGFFTTSGKSWAMLLSSAWANH